MKVNPKLLRQRLRHIRNELGVLELRQHNIAALGDAVKPSAMRKVQRRIAVLLNEEEAIRRSLGDWNPNAKHVRRRTTTHTATLSWRVKGFAYGNEGRTAGTADSREG